MANVLPRENQKDILRTQRTRFLLVFAEVALALAVAFYIALLPSYLGLTWGGTKIQNDSAAAASTTSYTTTMRNTKSTITQLCALSAATSTPSTLLQTILAGKPAGVTITSITYVAGNPSRIIIAAKATRSDLIPTYRSALEADPRFTTVSIPVSALVGSVDGVFIVTISGTF